MSDKSGKWWTAPASGEDGGLIMVTGRSDIEKFRKNPKFSIRVEMNWIYDPDSSGMPDKETSELMEKATDLLQIAFAKDPVAVMTGIFTGEGERNWIFYTLNTQIFGKKLNEALTTLPPLPIIIECENDPAWEAYDEMKELEIQVED